MKINPLNNKEGFSDLRNILIKNAKDGDLTIALSGGSTPIPFYEFMGRNPLSDNDIMLNVIWVDERFVPKGDERSNSSAAFKSWLENEYLASVYAVDTEDITIEDSVNDYTLLLADIKPDVVLLGMGEDGHFASVFPGQEFKGPVFSCKHPTDGTERISLNFETIAAAKKVILLISGDEKKRVFLEEKNLPIHRLAEQVELSVFSFE